MPKFSPIIIIIFIATLILVAVINNKRQSAKFNS